MTAAGVHIGLGDVSLGWSRDHDPALVIASGSEVALDLPDLFADCR